MKDLLTTLIMLTLAIAISCSIEKPDYSGYNYLNDSTITNQTDTVTLTESQRLKYDMRFMMVGDTLK